MAVMSRNYTASGIDSVLNLDVNGGRSLRSSLPTLSARRSTRYSRCDSMSLRVRWDRSMNLSFHPVGGSINCISAGAKVGAMDRPIGELPEPTKQATPFRQELGNKFTQG